MEGSPKVQRSAIMEHNFSIQYRPGEDKVVADAFSRLYAIYEPEVLAARTESEEREGRLPPALFMRYLRASSTRRSHRVGGKRRAPSPSTVQDTEFGTQLPRGTSRSQCAGGEVLRKHWPKMQAHTKQFIGQYTLCQKMSNIHWAIRTRPFTTAA